MSEREPSAVTAAAPPPLGSAGPRPLLELLPRLAEKVHFSLVAELPTPVRSLEEVAAAIGHAGADLWEKRDDRTSSIYGGNKVRTLEVLFGDALERGSTHIYSTGAYGSNHAAASAMHAPRVGLIPGAVLYPQPHSLAALENLDLVLSQKPRPPIVALPHWSALPWGMWRQSRDSARRGERATLMVPGGATPLGALGYVSAGIELALQIDRHELPRPAQVVVAIGSNCTSAGLLVGFLLAARRGIGFTHGAEPAPPLLVSVRVTPWPVTSVLRIVGLAARTARLVAELSKDPSLALGRREIGACLRLEPRYLGPGYGYPTDAGREAMRLWQAHAGHELETTYSGKAAAAALDRVRAGERGPILYWATKSSARLPTVTPAELDWAPPRMLRWMERARHADG